MSDTAPDGVLVVDKASGWTSHDVVGRMRRLAGTRKVGHAGTLDPMATGVLVLGVNRATRLLGHLALADKEYVATIRLGQSTVTDDAEGDLIAATSAAQLDEAVVRAVLPAFTGDIEQVPSSVSAIKVDGVRSYARVRSGEDVALKARQVSIGEFELTGFRAGEVADVDVRVVCSSGTYIRALARDIGVTLGVGGHLTALRRTRVGAFTIENAHTLEELAADLSLIGLDEVARETFASCDLSDEQAADVRFGRTLVGLRLDADGPVAVFAPEGTFLALYEQRGLDAKPIAVFI